MNEPQRQIILDAISHLGSGSFAASNDTPAETAKANTSLQAFRRGAQRKISFGNASSNDKSYLWRIHLAFFFVRRPRLNEWQKEIILAAMSLITPEYFDIQPHGSSGLRAEQTTTNSVTLVPTNSGLLIALQTKICTLNETLASAQQIPIGVLYQATARVRIARRLRADAELFGPIHVIEDANESEDYLKIPK